MSRIDPLVHKNIQQIEDCLANINQYIRQQKKFFGMISIGEIIARSIRSIDPLNVSEYEFRKLEVAINVLIHTGKIETLLEVIADMPIMLPTVELKIRMGKCIDYLRDIVLTPKQVKTYSKLIENVPNGEISDSNNYIWNVELHFLYQDVFNELIRLSHKPEEVIESTKLIKELINQAFHNNPN